MRDLIPFPGFMRRAPKAELAEITAAVRQAVEGMQLQGGIMIVQNLHVTVNYAAGGGATINVKAES